MTGRFNIATILVPLGLLFVGGTFLIVGTTGAGRITPLIFGGFCVVAALAAIIALITSLFKKKRPRDTATSVNPDSKNTL